MSGGIWVPMNGYGSLWVIRVSVGVYRWLWVFMDVYGWVDGLGVYGTMDVCLWGYMGVWVCFRVSMSVYRWLCMSMGVYRSLWVSGACLWGCLWIWEGGRDGEVWQSMGVYEYLVFDLCGS